MEKYIKKIVNKENLSLAEAEEAMMLIMEGKASEAQIGSFLTAMRMKGETVEEITASAKVMRKMCNHLEVHGDVMDIVGTGGDGVGTFNISTVSSFVVAATGIKVAKHGNRSVSSKCGSADVLESLGARLSLSPMENLQLLQDIGICFMFAQSYHGCMKYAAKPRRELAIRSIFNILGPLANPAYANLQLLGVYDEKLILPMAKVLVNLGVKRAMVVCGLDGLDEVSLTTKTIACEIRDGKLNSFFIEPEMLGLKRCHIQDLVGGEARKNADIALSILRNEEKGPKTDMVILNSGFAIYIGLGDRNLRECIQLAREMIEGGKALEKLNDFLVATHKVGEGLCI
nr:anthranilate phosphoribosyltransferase [uncultured Niameybacter sp.]